MAFKYKPRNTDEEPVVVGDTTNPHGYKITHPAYGSISVFRSSGHNVLYGSDFDHQHFIGIEIHHSEHHRNLANDWYFPREMIIRVAMSEMQWAQFVSAAGVGEGTPCTLEWIAGVGRLPTIPRKEKVELFADEIKKEMADAIKELEILISEIDQMGLSKAKADRLKQRSGSAMALMKSKMPWAEEQFREHMENTVEKAKAEVHGYVNSVLASKGLQALAPPETVVSPKIKLIPKGKTDAAVQGNKGGAEGDT